MEIKQQIKYIIRHLAITEEKVKELNQSIEDNQTTKYHTDAVRDEISNIKEKLDEIEYLLVKQKFMTQQIKQQLEEVIKKNLPEKVENKTIDEYDETNSRDEALFKGELIGFNQALSRIPVSLIVDELLKVVVEKLENYKKWSFEDEKNSFVYWKDIIKVIK